MVARIKPLDLGPFVPGVDNRRPEFKMKGKREDGGDFLRSAVNVDLSSEGTAKRRAGYTRVVTSADAHSLWNDGDDTFVVSADTLSRVTGLLSTPALVPIFTRVTPGRPVSYARAPTAVFFSDGISIGRLAATSPLEVCTPRLSVQPSVAASAGGALPAGQYGFCFSYLDAAGEESPTTVPVWADCPENGLITISNIPPLAAGTAAVAAYMTLPNDSVFQRVATLTGSPASTTIASLQRGGTRAETMLLSPMPAGDIVRVLSGRLLVAKGRVLYFSEPYRFGLTNPTKGFLQFPGDITVVEPTSGGVWVCADQTYWFAGLDIAAASLDSKASYGGVAGSSGTVPNSNDVFWMSPRGLVRGGQDGTFSNLQEARVAVAAPGFAAGAFREADGRKQFLESTFAVRPNEMAAASYMDAEVIRKGETL